MPSTVLSVVPAAAPPERVDHWLSLLEVRRKLGAAPATIYRLMARDPTFPRPAKLGRASRWSARELAAWMDSQLAARGR